MNAGLVKKSLTLAGHRTSVSLESEFWAALNRFAETDGCSLAKLLTRIDAERGDAHLASALRVYALKRTAERAER